jgi:hypothetical protein
VANAGRVGDGERVAGQIQRHLTKPTFKCDRSVSRSIRACPLSLQPVTETVCRGQADLNHVARGAGNRRHDRGFASRQQVQQAALPRVGRS